MLGNDVNKKVRTRNNEANDRVYHSQSLKRQYQTEIKKTTTISILFNRRIIK